MACVSTPLALSLSYQGGGASLQPPPPSQPIGASKFEHFFPFRLVSTHAMVSGSRHNVHNRFASYRTVYDVQMKEKLMDYC